MWPLRKEMRLVRWVIGCTLLLTHLVMKAPVWMLIARVNVMGSSSGYHRAMLVDQLIEHFRDWWLVGVATSANWGWDMWDQANQFVVEGLNGGLVAFVCFIALVCRCFGRLGSARRAVQPRTDEELFYWLLGVTLFAYCAGFFGISLSDQLRLSWLLLIAIISAAVAPGYRGAVVEGGSVDAGKSPNRTMWFTPDPPRPSAARQPIVWWKDSSIT